MQRFAGFGPRPGLEDLHLTDMPTLAGTSNDRRSILVPHRLVIRFGGDYAGDIPGPTAAEEVPQEIMGVETQGTPDPAGSSRESLDSRFEFLSYSNSSGRVAG